MKVCESASVGKGALVKRLWPYSPQDKHLTLSHFAQQANLTLAIRGDNLLICTVVACTLPIGLSAAPRPSQRDQQRRAEALKEDPVWVARLQTEIAPKYTVLSLIATYR